MEKITNVKAIDYVIANCEVPTEVKEKLEKMREQFVKKNSAERKPTANQVENQGYKADILAYLSTVKCNHYRLDERCTEPCRVV